MNRFSYLLALTSIILMLSLSLLLFSIDSELLRPGRPDRDLSTRTATATGTGSVIGIGITVAVTVRILNRLITFNLIGI